MNHAQIDHLLQATAPRPEPFSSASRAREVAPPFDNHFREANAASTSTNQPVAKSTPPSSEPSHSSSSAAPASPHSSTTNSDSDKRTTKASPTEESKSTPAAEVAAAESSSNESVDESLAEPTSELEENAEVAALLAAEQAAKASVKDVPAAEPQTRKTGVEAKSAAANVDGQPNADGANRKEPAVPTAPAATKGLPDKSGQKPDEAEAAATSSAAAVEASAVATDQVATEDAAAPVVEQSAEAVADRKLEPKPERSERRSNKHESAQVAQESGESSNAHPAAKVVAAIAPAASAQSAPAVERPEPAAKTNKKADARTDVAPRDAASAPVERPAAAPRAAETTSGTVVAAANVPPPVAAEAVAATASSPVAKSSGVATEAKPGLLSSLQRLDRSAAGTSRGAHRAGQSESAPHVDPARFVSRVARAVQTAQERGAPLQLRLSPPELGAMRIELSVNQGTLTATIETDNTNAKQILLDNLPQLRDRLADQNIKVERFDVDVRRDSSGSQQQFTSQDRDQTQRQQPATGNQANARRPSATSTLDEPQPVRRTISNTSINVIA